MRDAEGRGEARDGELARLLGEAADERLFAGLSFDERLCRAVRARMAAEGAPGAQPAESPGGATVPTRRWSRPRLVPAWAALGAAALLAAVLAAEALRLAGPGAGSPRAPGPAAGVEGQAAGYAEQAAVPSAQGEAFDASAAEAPAAAPIRQYPEAEGERGRALAPSGGESASGLAGAPALVRLELNEAGREEAPGIGVVHVLRPVAHVHAAVGGAADVQWRLYALPPEGAADTPLATLLPREVDGRWVLDWEDPPPQPVRLALYAEVPPAVPDHPSFLREGGRRWAVLASVVVRGTGERGDGTGVLTAPPPDRAALEELVRRFLALTAGGDYEAAWPLVETPARDPEAARRLFLSRQGQTGPGLAEVLGAQTWAGRKFYSCQCTITEVTEVVVRLEDGTRRSLWARRDERGRWRLVWDPVEG